MKINRICSAVNLLVISSLLATADELIKQAIEDGRINNGVIQKTRGFAEIEKHHNYGFAGNRLDKRNDIVKAVSVAGLTGQAVYSVISALTEDSPILNAANTFILAGALSNTYNRHKLGYVVDYIKLNKKRYIYNLSDFFIFAGAILAIIRALFTKE